MNKFVKVLSSVALAAAASTASAGFVNIGGLQVPTEAHFEVASIYENIISSALPGGGVGQVLSGVGEVTQLNGFATNTLCGGCELTYSFTGFTVTALTATTINFTGGVITFYLDFGGVDFNPFASANAAADLFAATDGTVFLTLAGHALNAAGDTFVGTGFNIGTATAQGSGSGSADVVRGVGMGIAQGNFDTNTIPTFFPAAGFADVQLNSSFGNAVVPHGGVGCPAGPLCLAGSADFRGFVIPEPSSVALVGVALLGLGAAATRRRRNSK